MPSEGFMKYRQYIKQTEAVAQRCSVKKVFLQISQNLQEKHLRQSPFF